MFKKILKYSGNENRLLKVSIFQSILSVVCSIIPYFMTYLVIDRLVTNQEMDGRFLLIIGITVLVTLILQNIFYLTGLSNSHIFAFNVLQNIRESLQEKLEALPIGYIQDKGKGTMKQVFVEDIDSIETLLAHAIPEGISNLLVTLIVIISMLFVDIRLGLLSLASFPIAIAGFMFMFKIGSKYMAEYYAAGQNMNNNIIEYINGMEVVKVFNQDGHYFGKYKESILNYRDKTISQYKATRPSVATYRVMFAASSLALLPVGSYLVMNQSASISNLVLVFCLATSLGAPLLRLVSFLPALMQINYKIDELENVMNFEPLQVGDNEFTGENYDVSFQNIEFSYDDTPVVRDLTLTAKEGETTAFVGESGSGKSTLAKLLVHYYDPNSGKITIGGQDIRELSLSTLGSLVSYVSQDVFLFNQSILENIRIGNPSATDEDVLEAARQAQCLSIFEHLPNGIHTVVGDKGGKLSGGEKQRISIARAFLKNSPIFLLDEAMAYIDSENEKVITQAINKLAENKTVITIAHRLKSIKDSERIYVLNKGRVECFGTHEGILSESETYQKLWNAAIKSEMWQPKGGH